jgi:protein-arginine deiminase
MKLSMRSLSLSALVVSALWACGPAGIDLQDSGVTVQGTPDGSSTQTDEDAGQTRDSGAPHDGGSTTDAGSKTDAGSTTDAGTRTDAGIETDAGIPKTDGGLPRLPTVDLRADVNRNGVVDLTDVAEDDLEAGWSALGGAIFLANIDDDSLRCSLSGSDVSLAACNDAADEIVNGTEDALDLAPLVIRAWADAPADATGKLTVTPAAGASRVRIFRKNGTSWTVFGATSTLTASDLRAGVEFGLEGKDILRDPAVWDGFVTVTYEMTAPSGFDGSAALKVSDAVKLRVSPVMTHHHLSTLEAGFVANVQDSSSTAFQSALSAAFTASGYTPASQLLAYSTNDQWIQDYFEPGYASMPGPGGAQRVMRVNYRSANVFSASTTSPLRPAGRIVYALRGKDTAAVQEYDPTHSQDMDSLNSFGNTEVIPPYSLNGTSYPLGRLFRGAISSFYPDPRFSRMIAGQGMQPVIYVDTSWLLVGHVDETFSFLKANNARGWIALVNDARLARKMLEDQVALGNGGTAMFTGKFWITDTGGLQSAQQTISQVLADTAVMSESASSAAKVDSQLAIVKTQTGLTDSEIIRVPYLHQSTFGASVAYQPGTANMLVLDDHHVVVPNPFGPIIGGKDIFKTQLENALAPFGYTVHWVDDWDLYHRNMGEVHCGTNAYRAIPSAKWWETGR